jgi:hypothetical protein
MRQVSRSTVRLCSFYDSEWRGQSFERVPLSQSSQCRVYLWRRYEERVIVSEGHTWSGASSRGTFMLKSTREFDADYGAGASRPAAWQARTPSNTSTRLFADVFGPQHSGTHAFSPSPIYTPLRR